MIKHSIGFCLPVHSKQLPKKMILTYDIIYSNNNTFDGRNASYLLLLMFYKGVKKLSLHLFYKANIKLFINIY